jgi:hypothetical protein
MIIQTKYSTLSNSTSSTIESLVIYSSRGNGGTKGPSRVLLNTSLHPFESGNCRPLLDFHNQLNREVNKQKWI